MVLALLLFSLNTSVGHGLFKQGLKHWVHPRVQLNGPVQLSVWPRLAMTADTLVVADTPNQHPWLSIGQFRLDLSWQGLFSGRVTVNQLHASDVTLWRTGKTWQPLLVQMDDQGVLGARSLQRRWLNTSTTDQVQRQLQIDSFTIERFNVVQRARPNAAEQPLFGLERLVMTASLQANPVPVGEITVQAQGLSVEPQASETFHAALEQVGLGGENAWLVERLQSRWQLSDGVARADALTATGAWGDLTASAGSINLSNGQTVLPLRVRLKGGVSMQARGIQIRTRQSDVSFELTGSLNNLGIKAPTARPENAPIPVMINKIQ